MPKFVDEYSPPCFETKHEDSDGSDWDLDRRDSLDKQEPENPE